MALKQSAPLAPHLSLIRALSQARMNLKCCSLVDEHWGAIVKRLKNQLQSKKAKCDIRKSWLYGKGFLSHMQVFMLLRKLKKGTIGAPKNKEKCTDYGSICIKAPILWKSF